MATWRKQNFNFDETNFREVIKITSLKFGFIKRVDKGWITTVKELFFKVVTFILYRFVWWNPIFVSLSHRRGTTVTSEIKKPMT